MINFVYDGLGQYDHITQQAGAELCQAQFKLGLA